MADRTGHELLRTTLRELRREHGLSQFELAVRIGGSVRPELISRVERGERRLDIFELIEWSGAFDMSLPQLLDRAGISYDKRKR